MIYYLIFLFFYLIFYHSINMSSCMILICDDFKLSICHMLVALLLLINFTQKPPYPQRV